MMNRIVLVLLIISLGVNLLVAGKWFLFDQWYEPSPEEKVTLSEMVQ